MAAEAVSAEQECWRRSLDFVLLKPSLDWHRPTLLLCLPYAYSSFDQYSNIVLSNTSERKVLGSSYYDEPLGLYVIRGENVVLLGDQVRHRTKEKPKEAGRGEAR